MSDDDVGADLADVSDEAADRFVEGNVNEPWPAGGRHGVAGVVVAEQARGAGAQGGQGVGEFGGTAAVGGPRWR